MPTDKHTEQIRFWQTGEETRECTFCAITKPITDFSLDKRNNRRFRHCKVCQQKAWKERRKKNPDKHAAMTRKYHLMDHFGLPVAEYEKMVLMQNGVCAICQKTESMVCPHNGKTFPLSVDHDHATGKVRSLLCKRCNMMIGKSSENPQLLRLAADYLERHSEPITTDG